MKKKLTIVIASICLILFFIIGCLLIINYNNIKIKKYENENVALEYDNTWKITDQNEDNLKFENDEHATLELKFVDVKGEYKYYSLKDLLNELMNNIISQNENYKVISQNDVMVTKQEYEGKKTLYETDKTQVMTVITKAKDKVIMFVYEADNEHFDLLLDSVQNIIYNTVIKDEKIDYNYKVNLKFDEKLDYQDNQQLIEKISQYDDYEIASDNYLVEYSIPSIFKLDQYDSKSGNFEYKENESSINLKISVNPNNIYEVLQEPTEEKAIYKSLDYEKKYANEFEKGVGTKENRFYSNFNEKIIKNEDNNKITYIYQADYKSLGYSTTNNIQKYYIWEVINNNNLIQIEIEGTDINIPKELLDSIKIKSIKNYSSYIKNNISNGKLNVELKKFIDYSRTAYEQINIKVPDKYKELDKLQNMFEERYFGLNYNEDKDEYKLTVKYSISSFNSNLSSEIKSINEYGIDSYNIENGKSNKLKEVNTIKSNNKSFKRYQGGFTNKNKEYVNKNVLFYKLDDDGYLVIEFDLIGKENEKISEKVINDFTDFEVKKY